MIDVKELRKTFRSKDRKSKRAVVEAVRSINFTVEKGEIFGLPGPNGAGETTTMRMLWTLLTLDPFSYAVDAARSLLNGVPPTHPYRAPQ